MSICRNCGKSLIYGDINLDKQVIGIRKKGVYRMTSFGFCSDKCLNEKFDELDEYEETQIEKEN